MHRSSVPLETLLAHREWVRRLARALVRDVHLADDVEQQAWMAALHRPPATEENVRGWFATVVRNAVRRHRRGAARRAAHEQAVAPSSAESVVETVARAETHRLLVEAVLSLPAEQRDVVLLRWFDGLPPREIAQRLALPPSTVKSRLRVALETLRRGNASDADERARWRAALLVTAWPREPVPPTSVAPLLGASLMLSTPKIAAVSVVAALTTLIAVLAAGDDDVAPHVEHGSAADVAEEDPPTVSPRRTRTTGDTEATAGDAPPEPEGERRLSVVVRREDGGDLDGGRALLVDRDGGDVLFRSALAGPSPRLDAPAPDRPVVLIVDAPGFAARFRPLDAGATATEVTLSGGTSLSGVVRVNGAAPRAPLSLRLHVDEATVRPDEVSDSELETAAQEDTFVGTARLRTDANGRFAAFGLPPCDGAWIEFPYGYVGAGDDEDGAEGREVELPARDVVLDLIRLPRVTGRVVDAVGRPVASAHLSVTYFVNEDEEGGTSGEAGEDGAFEVAVPVRGAARVLLAVAAQGGSAERQLETSLDGTSDRVLGDVELGAAETVRLRGLDPDGHALAGAVALVPRAAFVSDPTAPAGADGVVAPSLVESERTVLVAAPGHAVALLRLPAALPESTLDVHLTRATRLEIDTSDDAIGTDWTVRVDCPVGSFLPEGPTGDDDPTDSDALVLLAEVGGSHPSGTVSGPTGTLATFARSRGEPLVLVGARPGVTLRLRLLDGERSPRGTLDVTLASGETRSVRLVPQD